MFKALNNFSKKRVFLECLLIYTMFFDNLFISFNFIINKVLQGILYNKSYTPSLGVYKSEKTQQYYFYNVFLSFFGC